MCGRFALGISHDEIEQMHGYNIHIGEWVGRDRFIPRYNVAPRTYTPVIRRRDPEDSGSSRPLSQPTTEPSTTDVNANESATPSIASAAFMLQTMRWGLVPHYYKHDDNNLKTINARSEALIEEAQGMWASIKGKKRCAVVCQGFYEWLKKGKERVPHFTKRKDGRLMLLAGLWDCVVLEGSTDPLWTFTIVTTDANKEYSWLHDRQPVILADDAALLVWLNTSSRSWTPELSNICEPYHASDHPLICYQVPQEVGKVGTESSTFVLPIAERKDGIQAFFAKQARSKHGEPSSSKTDQRKRHASPVHCDTYIAKKPKVEKVDAWENDSDVEYVDHVHSAARKDTGRS